MNNPKFQNKPFKPPRRINTLNHDTTKINVTSDSEINKNGIFKRKSANDTIDTTFQEKKIKVHKIDDRFPLSRDISSIFATVYRKKTLKKNKVWTNDGFCILKNDNRLNFYDDAGNFISGLDLKLTTDSLFDELFKIGSLELQIDYKIEDPEETKKTVSIIFGRKADNTINSSSLIKNNSTVESHNDGNSNYVNTNQSKNLLNATTSTTTSDINRKLIASKEIIKSFQTKINNTSKSHLVPLSQLFAKKTTASFRQILIRSESHTPLTTPSSNISSDNQKIFLPVFDLNKISDPIVMNRSKDALVDVIVDPILGKLLRPHQREGVKFMYDCMMGLQRPSTTIVKNTDDDGDSTSKSLTLEYDSDIKGCLLADEMGLGKTLMTITLIWTLLKQTAFPTNVAVSQSGVPLHGAYKKFIIVCPVTLIGNWKREFGKWLGLSAIGILTLSPKNNSEKDKMDVRNFLKVQRIYQVLIIGYEKILSVSDDLFENKDKIDMIICDEGHRLKNGSSKILNALKRLDVENKVLLSGTPIQNDLNEFFTIIDFINPGILGSFNHFKKKFITPITRARDVNNRYNEDILSIGSEKSKEMIQITKRFVLRRTNSLLTKYLPPKNDVILFCKPTDAQLNAFSDIFSVSHFDINNLSFTSSLGLITLFKKICNTPMLIKSDSYYQSNLRNSSTTLVYENKLDSGKLKVFMSLLDHIRNATDEKVVIVSNYTQTLDILENLMRSQNITTCRLDGSTPNKQRDSIVTNFNRNANIFGFLLSSKSGGAGLNLIGASRLILFDNDWNPSIDLQAMSRIHRDGQKKTCHIYRLITTGCIDEKIFQRQLMKHSLSQQFLNDQDDNSGSHKNDDLFNKEDLKDLFTIVSDSKCNTHDLICDCDGSTNEDYSISTDDEFEDSKETSISSLTSNGWTSALNAQKLLEEREKSEKLEKTKIIKKCLAGYRHIDLTIQNSIEDSILEESLPKNLDCVTFAFFKPGKAKSL
ncbi:hypothetical protein TPHA_0M01230 [Tetrapisispora phaffii CBS 4417]|uniref:DNA repair and recombination protein RDH54 n=1 Tax=Tetrapisispora phaffii (strain ATCC 24235 / CBS 4417 / NBRC 1672 / NRRL Y-8282 / UCD 70-5) TaxID=1071381 RepID=G8C0I3_TETPH|nr:hypothetical protein TPHA_0M01230 [Tetrapisispora phaffii CBS 4417]CCE65698.1 hypothetical protein TPHA_0M01230 [Tetrapisispora phaffii CBS 4417]